MYTNIYKYIQIYSQKQSNTIIYIYMYKKILYIYIYIYIYRFFDLLIILHCERTPFRTP